MDRCFEQRCFASRELFQAGFSLFGQLNELRTSVSGIDSPPDQFLSKKTVNNTLNVLATYRPNRCQLRDGHGSVCNDIAHHTAFARYRFSISMELSENGVQTIVNERYLVTKGKHCLFRIGKAVSHLDICIVIITPRLSTFYGCDDFYALFVA